jgi:hypothetical protein
MAAPSIREVLAPLRVPGYSFFGVTLILQVADFILISAPPHFGKVLWRFSAYGTMASTIGNVILILLLMHALALALGDRKGLAWVAGLTGGLAVFLILASAGFMLDVFQVKSTITPAAMASFMVLSIQAFVKVGTYVVISILFATKAWGSYRSATRELERTAARPERNTDDLLIPRTPGPR